MRVSGRNGKGTNNVTELLLGPQLVEERLLDDRAQDGQVRTDGIVGDVTAVGELLDGRVDVLGVGNDLARDELAWKIQAASVESQGLGMDVDTPSGTMRARWESSSEGLRGDGLMVFSAILERLMASCERLIVSDQSYKDENSRRTSLRRLPWTRVSMCIRSSKTVMYAWRLSTVTSTDDIVNTLCHTPGEVARTVKLSKPLLLSPKSLLRQMHDMERSVVVGLLQSVVDQRASKLCIHISAWVRGRG